MFIQNFSVTKQLAFFSKDDGMRAVQTQRARLMGCSCLLLLCIVLQPFGLRTIVSICLVEQSRSICLDKLSGIFSVEANSTENLIS
jgi:hypothetical protein